MGERGRVEGGAEWEGGVEWEGRGRVGWDSVEVR